MPAYDLADVEIRHLLALRAVAEERSFGRAAERLGYTQSAVSQQIAALERAVGEPMFERPGGPRPVSLTGAGELLLGHAVAVLDRLSEARADLAGYREGVAGRIAVGTFQSASVRVLPRIVGRLRRESPQLRVDLVEHDETDLLVQLLVQGELDCAFVVGEPDDERGVDFEVMGRDPFLLMSPAEDALAPPGESVAIERLVDLPLVGQTPNTCQLLMERHMRAAGVEPNTTFRTSDNRAVQAMVASGGCHAIMPRLTIDTADPDVSIHPISPPLPPRCISLATPRGRHRPPAVDRFGQIAVEVSNELLADQATGPPRRAVAAPARLTPRS